MLAQTRKPDQLVIVDGSDPVIKDVVDEFAALPITYVRVFPPSLAEQRNAGMEKMSGDITLAGYLDDDIVLEDDAIERMMSFWENADASIGGVAFNITNFPYPQHIGLKRLFWIDSDRPAQVLPSGFVSSSGFQDKDIEADWLCGGATVWRRDVVENYRYDDWYQGMGFMEDVDYSFAVREKYRLVLLASARLAHYSRPIRPDRQFLMGKWQIVNRMRFVRKFRSRGLSERKAWIAGIALLILNLAKAGFTLNGEYWNRARGNIAGIFSEILAKNEQIGGQLKS
jgi:glycosyltransferase involved in cell wall biosynthesis